MIINLIQKTFGESGPKLPPIGQTLESYSWAEIDAISKAGKASEYFQLGDTKTFTHNGTTYSVEIEDFNHDDLADGSGKAGISFGMVNCLNTSYGMEDTNTNSNGYDGSQMHLTHLPAIKAGLNPDLLAVIKTVNKKTSIGNKNSTIENVPCDLYLRSEFEVFGTKSYSCAGEGTQYPVFATQNDRVKTVGGSASNWWLRSPTAEYATYFCDVSYAGAASRYSASYAYGVSFGFCV